MPSIRFSAPIIRAANASLLAGMPAHVAAHNAEPDVAVTLEVPAAYVFGVTDVMDVYPVIEATILDGTLGPFSTGTAGVGAADHTPRLTVVTWLQGLTGEMAEVYEQALGYVRCVIEILCEPGALGETAEVAGERQDAIDYTIGVIAVNPDEPDRALRKWKVPAVARFVVEAVEPWSP